MFATLLDETYSKFYREEHLELASRVTVISQQPDEFIQLDSLKHGS